MTKEQGNKTLVETLHDGLVDYLGGATMTRIAKLLGEYRAAWYRYYSGSHSIGINKIESWLVSLKKAGLDVTITFTSEGATVNISGALIDDQAPGGSAAAK